VPNRPDKNVIVIINVSISLMYHVQFLVNLKFSILGYLLWPTTLFHTFHRIPWQIIMLNREETAETPKHPLIGLLLSSDSLYSPASKVIAEYGLSFIDTGELPKVAMVTQRRRLNRISSCILMSTR